MDNKWSEHKYLAYRIPLQNLPKVGEIAQLVSTEQFFDQTAFEALGKEQN